RPGRRSDLQKQDRLDRWRRRRMDVPAALVCLRRVQFPGLRHQQFVRRSLRWHLYSQRQSRLAERASWSELQVLEQRRANRTVAAIKPNPEHCLLGVFSLRGATRRGNEISAITKH